MGVKLLALLLLLATSLLHFGSGHSATTAASAPATPGGIAICSKGSGAGDCTKPQGIAVDTETGAVYVADSGNDRIDAFESTGGDPRSFGKAEVQTWLA